MLPVTEDQVRALLGGLRDDFASKDLLASGAVRGIGLHGDRVAVELRFGYPLGARKAELAARIKAALEAHPGISQAVVSLDWKASSRKVQGELKPHEQIRNIIAVASGKGGVGKSTTAVNLALALARDGAQVGLLDADIYGPSIPRMLGVAGQPATDGKRIVPHRAHGLALMSMGFLVEEETPMIWRGPMVTSALQQMLGETDWGELDYLVIDLPPGTGDIQLTLVQKVPVAGAVIVTTPQDIALLDARRALLMFRKLNVAVLGVVENMSTHVCTNCGHAEAIFGSGGGTRMATDYEIPLLGQLPLAAAIRADLDQGRPTMVADPEGPIAAAYQEFARRVAVLVAERPMNLKLDLPQVRLQDR